jgi:hypothetical protein
MAMQLSNIAICTLIRFMVDILPCCRRNQTIAPTILETSAGVKRPSLKIAVSISRVGQIVFINLKRFREVRALLLSRTRRMF